MNKITFTFENDLNDDQVDSICDFIEEYITEEFMMTGCKAIQLEKDRVKINIE